MNTILSRYYNGFLKAPLFWSALIFSLGIALSSEIVSTLWLLFISWLILGIVFGGFYLLFKKIEFPAYQWIFFWLCGGLTLAGAGYYHYWLKPMPDNQFNGFNQGIRVRALIRVQRPSECQKSYCRLLGDLVWIDDGKGAKPAQGKVWLNYHSEEQFFKGDEIIGLVRLNRIKGFKNFYVPDPSLRLARAGIYFSARQVRELPIYKVGASRKIFLPALYQYRNMINEELEKSGASSSYLLSALLLGERGKIPEPVWRKFQATNSNHILVVSGLHLGLVSGFYFLLFLGFLRVQPWLLKRIDPYPIAGFLSIIPTTFYALISGFRIPTFRAWIMVLTLLFAIVLRKYRSLVNALGLAGIIILILDPSSLFDASFQLSFLAVLVLIWYFPDYWRIAGGEKLKQELYLTKLEKKGVGAWMRRLWLKIAIYFYGIFIATILIQLFLAPLNAYYFSQISLLGPFANLIIIPLCGLWVCPVGFLGLWFVAFSPEFAEWLFNLAGIGAQIMEQVVGLLASFEKFNFLIRPPTGAELFGWFLALFSISELTKRISPPGEKKAKPNWNKMLVFLWAGLLMISGLALIFSGYQDVRKSRERFGQVQVNLLDVGLGQSLVIELDKKYVLLDGGGRLGRINLGEAVVSRFLLARGIKKLEFVILSHPEQDHSAGLEYISTRFKVKELWLTGKTNSQTQSLLEIAQQRGIKLRWINSNQPLVTINGAKFEILHPAQEGIEKLTVNDSSAVIKMTYGKFSFLFPGDISARIERKLVQQYGDKLKSTILVASHHGSDSGSSKEFLNAVSPKLILISGGESHFGLPSDKALERMRKYSPIILRTDQEGGLEISANQDQLQIKTFSEKTFILDRI